ncbi:MAG: XdhC/CoxI family protein [Verrucomicrobia bacterium]|nr:MAG: XdhC/CoxI family protein [Verrucomicrobiota bacterium]
MGNAPKTATEPPDLLRLVSQGAGRSGAAAAILVLQAAGSCSAPAGTLAVVEDSGRLHGTVGGGAVEAAALEVVREVLADGRPRRFRFALQGADPAAPVPVCGGWMELLVWRPTPRHQAVLGEAADALAAGRSGFLELRLQRPAPTGLAAGPATTADPPGRPVFLPCTAVELIWREAGASGTGDESAADSPAGSGLEGAVESFVFPLRPRPRLIIAGGGHVGRALAHCAAFAGFAVEVVEDRSEFARPERFPEGTRIHLGPVAAALRRLPLGPDAFVALVTRNHLEDTAALEAVLGREAAYVGMIGSRRKVAMVRQTLLESGRAQPGELARLHAPIGLEIGAVTPAEIAVSIVAEMIAVRRGVASGPAQATQP